jgi:glycerol-3-phosphate dehydrogenase
MLLASLPGADQRITDGLSEQRVRFAVRHEFARSVEDVLARRSRLLFLDARAARAAAPAVASLLREEGITDPGLADFLVTCDGYLPAAGDAPGVSARVS